MKSRFFCFLTSLLFLLPTSTHLKAEKGMWLPILLKKNEAEMRRLGMKISIQDIYQANATSLKDAIVLFGNGCTGSYVSDQGLVLTNHHCGYSYIVNHSTLENNYLTKGFWATTREEEIPCPGLKVTSLVRMEDVTDLILNGLTDRMDAKIRDSLIKMNIEDLRTRTQEGTPYQVDILPIYFSNQFLMFVNQVFEDVRLVGAPPSNIGKFGGDTDNWMWPRHTGDFALFRVYVDSSNSPAKYSKGNLPYKPKRHLQISLKGVNEGDFTFVMGYPARTQQYLTSTAVRLLVEQYNPTRISLRSQRLDIYNEAMNKSEAQRLRYAGVVAQIANGWKKMQGESKGIKRLHTIENKKETEHEFSLWAEQVKTEDNPYRGIFVRFDSIYKGLETLELVRIYQSEAILSSDLTKLAYLLISYMKEWSAKVTSTKEIQEKEKRILSQMNTMYVNFDQHRIIDRAVFVQTLSSYIEAVRQRPEIGIVPKGLDQKDQTLGTFLTKFYDQSILSSEKNMRNVLSQFNERKAKKLKEDPLIALLFELSNYWEKYYPNERAKSLNDSLSDLYRIYMKGLMEKNSEHSFFPDANSTLRIAYGSVKPYSPADGVEYKAFSTIEGIMQKENPAIYDYVVEPKLKELYFQKDYGDYQTQNATLPVAFIATNHTTGGNSGSPVLNAEGSLIGLNFDRCWEGTMSDIIYDPEQCRNIILDIRYCLFIIDKYAGATRLVQEMRRSNE